MRLTDEQAAMWNRCFYYWHGTKGPGRTLLSTYERTHLIHKGDIACGTAVRASVPRSTHRRDEATCINCVRLVLSGEVPA